MRPLRFVVGFAVLAYALMSGAIAAGIAAVKLDVWKPSDWGIGWPPIAEMELQLAASVPWAQLVLWAAVVLLYVTVAIKLIRRAKTFLFWSFAFVLSAANWLWLRASPAYDAGTPPDLVNLDYYVLGASLVVGVLILVMGRTHLD
jgi:hypothetical protein